MPTPNLFAVSVDGKVWLDNLHEAAGWTLFFDRIFHGTGEHVALLRGGRQVAELRSVILTDLG